MLIHSPNHARQGFYFFRKYTKLSVSRALTSPGASNANFNHLLKLNQGREQLMLAFYRPFHYGVRNV